MTTYTLVVRNGETVANCARLSEAALCALNHFYVDRGEIEIKCVDVDNHQTPYESKPFEIYLKHDDMYIEGSMFVCGVAWAMGLNPTFAEGAE